MAVSCGKAVDLQASYSDLGSTEMHTVRIDWGDGIVEPTIVDQGANTLSGSYIYAASGGFSGMVTVTDDGGGSGSQSDIFAVVFNKLFLPMLTR